MWTKLETIYFAFSNILDGCSNVFFFLEFMQYVIWQLFSQKSSVSPSLGQLSWNKRFYLIPEIILILRRFISSDWLISMLLLVVKHFLQYKVIFLKPWRKLWTNDIVIGFRDKDKQSMSSEINLSTLEVVQDIAVRCLVSKSHYYSTI